MKESIKELLKHTRSELEEMAEKIGISTVGASRIKIAESILEARKKAGAKEIPKPKGRAIIKGQPTLRIGKKGVFAKRAAIDAQAKENENFATKMGMGVREMHRGIKEIQNNIGDQVKENENFATKMGMGVREMHRGIKEIQKSIGDQAKENENFAIKMGMGIKEMHADVKELQNNIKEMGTEFKHFRDETVTNYVKEFYYG